MGAARPIRSISIREVGRHGNSLVKCDSPSRPSRNSLTGIRQLGTDETWSNPNQMLGLMDVHQPSWYGISMKYIQFYIVYYLFIYSNQSLSYLCIYTWHMLTHPQQFEDWSCPAAPRCHLGLLHHRCCVLRMGALHQVRPKHILHCCCWWWGFCSTCFNWFPTSAPGPTQNALGQAGGNPLHTPLDHKK